MSATGAFPMNLVQISDTHFGTEVSSVEDALVDNLRGSPPDILMLTGDVTQRARRGQFDRAKKFLTRLPAHDFIVIPGNHDIPLFNLWRRLTDPYRDFRRAFNEIEATRFTESCTVISINTTCPTRHKDGKIDAETIDKVVSDLEKGRDSHLRIVAAHHPAAVVLHSDKENLVQNAGAAIAAWSAAGMDLMLGGHIHYPFMAPLRGYYPHIDTHAWVMQAGTAVSRRVRSEKPNSFNRIIVEGARETARIEQWNYDGETGRFELVESFTPWQAKVSGAST